jgi:flagellum-specific peptidoglycan hydrolase FlgJ
MRYKEFALNEFSFSDIFGGSGNKTSDFQVKVPTVTKGPEIRDLQQALQGLGFSVGPPGVDGILGPYTRGAIAKYQAARNLPATNQADTATVARLNTELKSKPNIQSKLKPSTQSDVGTSSAQGSTPRNFTGKGVPSEIVSAAKSAQEKWGVPAEVSIAQWQLESGGGKHTPPGSNNYFGVKANKQQIANGDFVVAMTNEYDKAAGRMVRVPQKFAKYPSAKESFEAHAKLLATSGHYAKARQVAGNPHAYADALTGVYATDPNYGSKLKNIMAKLNLSNTANV